MKYWTSSLAARSFLASYQDTATLPVDWSTSSQEKNWLAVPASSFTRTREDQVAPWSSEEMTKTSVSSWLVP